MLGAGLGPACLGGGEGSPRNRRGGSLGGCEGSAKRVARRHGAVRDNALLYVQGGTREERCELRVVLNFNAAAAADARAAWTIVRRRALAQIWRDSEATPPCHLTASRPVHPDITPCLGNVAVRQLDAAIRLCCLHIQIAAMVPSVPFGAQIGRRITVVSLVYNSAHGPRPIPVVNPCTHASPLHSQSTCGPASLRSLLAG
jgi:hypothetical protein